MGHVFTYTSPDIPLGNRCGGKIFINDLDLASPTVVSGNNFSKTHMLFHFLQMPMFSLTTFHACLPVFIYMSGPGLDRYYQAEQVKVCHANIT